MTKTENRKVLWKLMGSTIYGKTRENLRNRIYVKLVSNEKDYLKCTPKPSCMPQKTFENNLVVIRKSKIELSFVNPHTMECAY